nr:S8 family peptidase [Planomicrobium sp. YIM 101495]
MLSAAASLLMAFSLVAPGLATAEVQKNMHQSVNGTALTAKEKLSDRLLTNFKDEEKVTFLVKFKEKGETEKVAASAKKAAEKAGLSAQRSKLAQRSAVVSELKATSLEEQQSVLAFLEAEEAKGNVEDIEPYYIVNGMAVTATKEIAEKIAGFAEVEKVLANETRQLFTTKTPDAVSPESQVANVEWNVERVKAPDVWDMGIDGSGTVVASIDTGVQWDHPALKEKYRGYNAATGEVDHDYNWFDATAGQTTPYDDQGHGTHVTGTMVGAEPDGSNQVGVAPGAKWIGVKAFTAAGGSDADLLAAAQWILAPTDADGNTRVDLAPDVVNNSWGGGAGLDEWYRDVVINWRAAEIFPEFSAGNTTFTNPGGPGSVAAPANYPESFATGATDINNVVGSFSLRGPSPYDEIKPDISAPGVNIRSSVPGSGYEGGWNGTSMAGPAVAAVAAMLRQVNADITVDEMERVLLETATPLTDENYPETPNHGYGYGLVDAYEAVSSILDGIGTLEGQVAKQGDDTEAPAFEHEAPAETYAGMDLELSVSVTDDISIASVTLNYLNADGEFEAIEASRKAGDFKSGEFAVAVPGDAITGESFVYNWTITDFGNNEVVSDDYTVEVKPGITVGYSEDFEAGAVGWTSTGSGNTWERGVPTTGPGNAASGENVFATNLTGNYDSGSNATLILPPVDLPEGDSYLQFNHWFDFEESSTGRAWDYGHVYISTDGVEWTALEMFQGASEGWLEEEVSLSEYSGQRVYLGFNLYSDGSVVKEGWYIDDVALTDASGEETTAPGKVKPDPKFNKGKLNAIKNPGKSKPGNEGSMKDKDPNAIKNAVKPQHHQPAGIESIQLPAVEAPINPTILPLGAQVSVLESGRSVYTNPANGSYSFSHQPGEFTVKAEAYGFQSAEQSVVIEADETTSANFVLDEIAQNTVSGTVTDGETGEAIEGATVLVVEDANVSPVVTDADGAYSITAYEGEYTVKVVAEGYHGAEATVEIGEDAATLDFALEPFYTVPGGEIGYDDGTGENARAYNDGGNAWAVKMTLPEGNDAGIVTDGVFRFWDTTWPSPGGTEFAVEVWDATGVDGTPGKLLAGPVEGTALRNGDWTVVDLSEHNIMVSDEFYMVYRQTKANPNTPGLATDEDGPNAERSFQQVGGAWSASPAEEGNYMIRARVSYEVSTPVITTPEEGFVTNNPELVVEGTASPTTEVVLENNGEAVATAEIGSDGTFAIPVELTEGANELVAVTLLDGRETGESSAVNVTLDTQAPTLTIDNPVDGSKTNRETVTVQGTVTDAYLDTVTVNGQQATVTDGSYSKRILLDEGDNEITVVATDTAGNETTQSATLTAKFTAPVIEGVTPAEDLELSTGYSVKVEFHSEPGLKASFMIHMPLTNVSNATELPVMEVAPGHYVGYWTVPHGTVANGAAVEAKVVDSFGNETRKAAEGKLYINQ